MTEQDLSDVTPAQERAIIALLAEPSVQRAADACKLSRRTVYRWLERPEFARAYRRARREAFGQAIGMLQRLAPVAVTALAKVVTDPASPSASRVSAAAAMLRFGRDSIELDDLAARVEAIESSVRRR